MLIFLPILCSGSFIFRPYASIRNDLKFPSYTPLQRLQVATQAKHLLGIYVNRESKIENYGVDPLPIIDTIIARASTLTDNQFHFQMSSLFTSLRDFHTNYYLPGPYQCYRAVFPIDFEMIGSSDLVNDPIVVVKGPSSYSEVIQNMPPTIQNILIGDVLVSFDGKSFKEFYNDYKNKTGGANEYGGMRSALTLMSYVNGKISMLPEKDTVTYTFLSAKSLQQYTVTLPITARIDLSCLNKSPEVNTKPGKFFARPSNDRLEFDYPGLPLTPNQQEDMMAHPYMEEIANAIAYQDYATTSTTESSLSWSIYTSKKGVKLGIIRLETFNFVSDTLKGVLLIQHILNKKLKDTHAVLFDVRNNGGGAISLAEGIPQLFARSRVSTTNARALFNQINERLFLHPDMRKDWGSAFLKSKPGDTYTPLVKFTKDDEANTIGNAYSNPVGVFANSMCFSACDLFAAGMQDAGMPIFSHDVQTGGGGANVVEFNSYLALRLPAVFNKSELFALQDMRVSWRQAVRSDGKRILEDFGVTSDFVLRPKVEDLLPNQTVFSYLESISDLLFDASVASIYCKGLAYLDTIEPLARRDVHIGEYVEFNCTVNQIDKIQILLDGEVVGESLGGLEASTLVLKTAQPVSVANYLEYSIIGFHRDRRIFTAYRSVRSIPAEPLLLIQGKSVEWNLRFDEFARVYNVKTLSADGWNCIDNGTAVAIHDGGKYSNNVESSISFFIKVPAATDPTPGCTQNYEHWRDISAQESQFDFDQIEGVAIDQETAELAAWTKMPATLENSEIPLKEILDDEKFVGVYYDLAREWIAMSLNIELGSPASNQTLSYQIAAKCALLHFPAEEMTMRDKIQEIPINSIIVALSDYNNGRSVDLYPGNPLSCTLNPFMQVDVDYDTERARDRIFINAKLDGLFHHQFDSASGEGKMTKVYFLDSYTGEVDPKNVEIEIRFVSYDGATSKGVRINKLVFGA